MLVHTQRQDLVASSVRFLSVSCENYSTDQIINKFLSWVWICMSALQKFLQMYAPPELLYTKIYHQKRARDFVNTIIILLCLTKLVTSRKISFQVL